EGLVFVRNALVGAGLKDQVKIVASGKIASGFHMIRALALGADVCASARGMMFALGCIQARRCNSNDCPVGVATQNLSLARGLVPADKAQRVARYHHETIHAFLHLLAAGGFSHPDELGPQHVMRRVAATDVRTLSQVYPFVDKGSLLDGSAPAGLLGTWDAADSTRFGF
ncbi:MAG: glutamate synthase domain-containing protein 2, partial [Myxococcota bacterium]